VFAQRWVSIRPVVYLLFLQLRLISCPSTTTELGIGLM
jgi:hypothetical protein